MRAAAFNYVRVEQGFVFQRAGNGIFASLAATAALEPLGLICMLKIIECKFLSPGGYFANVPGAVVLGQFEVN